MSPGWKGSGGLYSSQAHTFPAVLDDAAARGGHTAAGHCRTCWCCSGSQFPLFLLRLPVLCGAAQIPVPSVPAQAPGSLCPCSDPGSLPCQLDVAVPRVGACADRRQCRQLVSAGSWSVPAAGQYQDPPGHCSGPLGTRSSVNPSCSPLGAVLCSPVNSKPCHNVLFPEKLGFVSSKSL